MIETEFERFVRLNRTTLESALTLRYGIDRAQDAAASAFAYAWEHWGEVQSMANPMGYLYRVAQSSLRQRRQPRLPAPAEVGLPDIEPLLIPALAALPETQRTALWLVYACQWTYPEAATAMGVSQGTVGTHLKRGLISMKEALEGRHVRQ